MAYSLSPLLKPRFFVNATNKPLVGGKLYTYLAETTIPATTYSNDTGTPNTNPIILDANGECNLYLDDDVSYRLILKDANDVTYFDKDRVSSIGGGDYKVLTFNTIADLRLKIGSEKEPSAQTSGYYAAGDGGGNRFYWDGTSSVVDNGGTIIKPTFVSGAGRWLAVNSNNINVKQFGAKGNAIVDDTSFIQAAINFAALSGLVVNIPKGHYIVNGTLTLKAGVKVQGVPTNPYNAAAYYASIITHTPASPNTDLFALETPATPTSYVSCGGVENLFIAGSANTRYAFNLTNPLGARFKNIGTANAFSSVISLKGQLNCYFSDFRIINTSATQMSAAILMRSYNAESYGTTCTFERFYISGTLTSGAGGILNVFKAEPAASNSVSINDFIVESITGIAFNICKGNEVVVRGLYTENVPNANVSTPVFEVGVTGAAAPNNAFDTVTSLSILDCPQIGQYSQGSATNTVLINSDVCQYIVINNVQLTRCIKLISGTNNTQKLRFNNLNAPSVTTVQTGMTPYKIEEGAGCFFNTYLPNSVNYEVDTTKNTFPKSLLKNGGIFIATDVGTEGALSWLNRAGAQFNYTAIKYSASPANAVWRAGDVVVNSAPAIGESMGWTATANGTGGAANWIIRGQCGVAAGTTASRPTKTTQGVATDAAWAGTMYFDTTLAPNGKPIWWTGTVWVDALGVSV